MHAAGDGFINYQNSFNLVQIVGYEPFSDIQILIVVKVLVFGSVHIWMRIITCTPYNSINLVLIINEAVWEWDINIQHHREFFFLY